MTVKHRLRALAATFLITAGFGIATAPAASAATCEYFADLPAKVTIDRPSVQVPVVLKGCEGYFDWASATIYGPRGVSDSLFYDGSRTDYWLLYDWYDTPGAYNSNDGDGYSTLGAESWRGDTSVVKYGSRAGVSATRVGTRVTLGALATRYNPSTGTFIPYANRVIAFQHCLTQTSGCSTLAYAVTNSAGRATITVSAPALRSYQVAYGDTGSFWGSTSIRVRQ